MKTIHKQILNIVDTQTITVPKGSKFLSVGNQNGDVCIWYACDTRNEPEEVTVYVFGTGGNHIDPMVNAKFMGSVMTHDGYLVWHVFT